MWLWMAAGAVIGAGGTLPLVLYIQRKRRAAELEALSGLIKDVLDEKEIQETGAGEETLYARMEHMLVRIQRMSRGRQQELEESRSRIQKLITEIAHQMRTPLANAGTYLELLEGELSDRKLPADSPAPFYLDAVRASQEKLRFLTEEFIKMSRLENRMIRIRKEETDIGGTLECALDRLHMAAKKKELTICAQIPEGLSCPHDPGWLGEALWNVLDNSVKYSHEKGRIWVEASQSEMYLTIRVADEGIGMEEGEETLVFQRFYRGRRTTSFEGFGIGLYLAREIILQHDGFMTIRRREPGVEVKICLPVA